MWYGAAGLTAASLLTLLAITLIASLVLLASVAALFIIPPATIWFANASRAGKPFLRGMLEAIPVAMGSLFVLSSVAIVGIQVVALFAMGVAVTLSSLYGFEAGWKHGFTGLILTPLKDIMSLFNLLQGRNRQNAESNYNSALMRIVEESFNAYQGNRNASMSEEQWRQMALTENELDILKKEYQALDETQEAFLQTKRPNDNIEHYFDLKEKLADR